MLRAFVIDLRRRLSLVLLAGTIMSTAACGHTVVIVRSVGSPDGKLVADWYSLAGGGAAGWEVSRVRLRPATESFHDDNNFSLAVLSGVVVDLKWTDSTNLQISYLQGSITKRTDSQWRDVSIHYKQVLDLNLLG